MASYKKEDIAMLYEFRDIYDGYSVVQLKDGSFVNRWDETEHPYRYAQTEKYIKELEEYYYGN